MFGVDFLHSTRPNEDTALVIPIDQERSKTHTKFQKYITYPAHLLGAVRQHHIFCLSRGMSYCSLSSWLPCNGTIGWLKEVASHRSSGNWVWGPIRVYYNFSTLLFTLQTHYLIFLDPRTWVALSLTHFPYLWLIYLLLDMTHTSYDSYPIYINQ
jgi:hypothetical protein